MDVVNHITDLRETGTAVAIGKNARSQRFFQTVFSSCGIFLRFNAKSPPYFASIRLHFMAHPMIATTPLQTQSIPASLGFELLLIGDLRELLQDPPGRQRDRWLLATLDMLLISRPRTPQLYLPVLPREASLGERSSGGHELPLPFEKLQRLRDRIAHRASYEALAEELLLDLHV